MRCLRTLIVALFAGCLLLPSAAEAKGSPSQIAYVHGTELTSVAPNGSHRHVIGRVPRGVVDLSASADGRLFALLVNRGVRVGERGSDRALYLLRPGRGLRLLERWHDTGPLSVALSPQSDQLAYARRGEIWLRRVDGGTARPLTAAPGMAADPAYVPDGNSLIFHRENGLYSAPLGGGEESQVLAGDFSEPAVSPSGLVAFRAADRGRDRDWIGLFAPGYAGPRLITRSEDPFRDGGPAFDPDGHRIAFISQRETPRRLRYAIETVGPSGANRRVVLGDIGAGSIGPVWTRRSISR